MLMLTLGGVAAIGILWLIGRTYAAGVKLGIALTVMQRKDAE